ncbi:MAG: formylglycine-generating enzyme family protein, partial [Anaerolineae bacterium]|nr:formylglycine-generating enzyme family protein [Anaerolineae bacterium]
STPTANITASIEAFRTDQAQTATESHFRDLTMTATLWTDTPTPTASPTLTPLEAALERAYAFGDLENPTNGDWQPFVHLFEDGVPMVLVPTGCFRMGSEDGHEQCFDRPFWIDQTEVTQAQFARLGGSNANGSCYLGENRPETCLTWFEARDFCESRGAQLPTEREWEYAARGVESWVYPWGNEAPNANLAIYSRGGTADVLSVPDGNSWVGAADMAGNVLEWTSTTYDQLRFSYPYSLNDERDNTDLSVNHRVLRGGSWFNDGDDLRAAYRYRVGPPVQFNFLGFRCARFPDS